MNFEALSVEVKARLLIAAKLGMLRTMRDRTPVHKAADANLPAMTTAIHYAFEQGRAAYKAHGTEAAVEAIHEGVLKAFPQALLNCLAAGGRVALVNIPSKTIRAAQLKTLKPFNVKFDAKDPNAIKWAKAHAAELAKGISESARDRIKNAIADAVAGEGVGAAEDKILDAVGSAARAEVIARTETMTAANEGNRQGWRQAASRGLLEKDQLIEWIATSDCCDDCDDLDKETRPLDGEYDDPDAGDGPPLHPNCRCTEGISAGSAE